MELIAALRLLIEQEGVPIFGIADAAGFQKAQPDWHPQRLMPRARRAVVFGRPFVGPRLVVDEQTNLSSGGYWKANEPVMAGIARLRGGILNLLDGFGVAACNFGGFSAELAPTFSYRLAQHEAGVGVYGRFGVCLNPTYGCYYTTGVLLTDAELPVTPRHPLDGFFPCRECSRCAQVCPVNAIDPRAAPESGYDREKCLRYIRGLKRKYGTEAKACARCFAVCPWSSPI